MNEGNLQPISKTRKGKWGGAREGAGRKLQPSQKALRKIKRYMELLYASDAKLMAHIEHRPEEFADQVQFVAGPEDENGNVNSGRYQLDPIFALRVDLLKFRCKKFWPNPPKEVEVSGEMEMRGLPPQMLQVLLQPLTTYLNQSNNKPRSLEIQSSSPEPSASHALTNGKSSSSMTAELQAALLSGVQTESVKQ